jgi:hypothetical protein
MRQANKNQKRSSKMITNTTQQSQGSLTDGYGFEDEDLHAQVLSCIYRDTCRFVPLLQVQLTRPFGGLPVGTRLALRLNDYDGRRRWRVRLRWRLMLPGARVVASDIGLDEPDETLEEGSVLWALYFQREPSS